MDVFDEVVRRIARGQPFRVAVPLDLVTEVLSKLAAQVPLPAIVVRRAEFGAGDALLDIAGRGDNWMLAGGAAPES